MFTTTSIKFRRRDTILMLGAAFGLGACSPVTLVQRAIEARSLSDIAEDNRIVVSVNRLMAKYKTISVSTEIYEQKLIVYGIMDDKSLYDGFRTEVGKVGGVKKLFWQVRHMTEAEQEAKKDQLLGFAAGLKVKAAIEVAWLDAPGVESVNFRVAVDPLGSAYVIGRAKTAAEKDRAIAVVRDTERVKRVNNYIVVR